MLVRGPVCHWIAVQRPPDGQMTGKGPSALGRARRGGGRPGSQGRRATGLAQAAGDRATRTGTGALRTTRSETLPMKIRSMPRRPCEPTTMRSTPSATAASTIDSPGSPSQMRQRIATPSFRPRSTIDCAADSRADRAWSMRSRNPPPGSDKRRGSMTLTSRTELPRLDASSKARLSAVDEAGERSLARRMVRIVRVCPLSIP